jgi:DNA polymerase-3 subunit alpha
VKAIMQNQFVHLHVHSDYSLLDGAIQVKALARGAAELKMPAVAVTDHGNLFGAVSFYNAMTAAGVKPIIGIEAYFTRGSRFDKAAMGAKDTPKGIHHIVLLAKDLTGYQNLVKLSSFSYLEGFHYKPRIDKELLSRYGGGLVALSSCMSGVPASLVVQGKFDEAAREALEFQDILGKGNYFLEIQDHGIPGQQEVGRSLRELSVKTGIPMAVTNDCHYLRKEDSKAHDILLCIGTGKAAKETNRLHYKSDQLYFKSAEEMWQLFGNELPEALEATVQIAEMCNLTLPKPPGVGYLPVFPVPDGYTTDSYFETIVKEGFAERLEELRPKAEQGTLKYSLDTYAQRLEYEIKTIKQMGFPGYFLIVWDLIRYARSRGIPVGPGRGSSAGSLVAYCMRITNVDPIQYDLMFERFLSPARVTMPDIDIDFCVRGRQAVINYVSDLYGRENVSQIITFGTLASRAVIKDVGRVMDMKYSDVEKVAGMIPPPIRGRNVSIEDAIKRNSDLKRAIDTNPQVGELIDLAQRLEGCARHSSIHAAGIVISPKPLHDLVPVYKTSKDEITTQFALSDLEKTGMLKMDFLALTTLTIIDDCVKMIEEETGEKILPSKIPLDDKPTLQLFAAGNTDAIFQFEGGGISDLCRRLKPDQFEDLVALNALYRPGPLDSGMVDEFIERRHGRRRVTYEFPELKEVMGNTFGVYVYQEQIMAIFQRLADYSLGEADLVRRAMGKKKREELDKHKEKFLQRATAKGHHRAKLEKLWASIEGFADYAFPRAHSTAYGLLAYQTAYLKAHYPTHFYAAVMSNELGNTDKVVKYINQARSAGIEILPPDVNVSREGFTPQGGKIRFGLVAIKGIGLATVQAIIAARQAGGPFRSMFDFAERVDPKALNKRVFESLIKAGAFDSVAARRSQLFAAIDQAIDFGARRARERQVGQFGLFGSPSASATNELEPPLPALSEWPIEEKLAGEKETLGFYVTGHPLDKFKKEIADYTDATTDLILSLRDTKDEMSDSTAEPVEFGSEFQPPSLLPAASPTSGAATAAAAVRIAPHAGRIITIAGIVNTLNLKTTKKGDRFAILTLEDQYGSLKVVVWPETYSKTNGLLKDDAMVVIKGKLEIQENAATLIAEEVTTLESLQEAHTKKVVIRLKAQSITPAKVDLLYGLFDRHRGNADVLFEVECAGALAVIKPNPFVKIKPSPEVVSNIKRLCAGCDVVLANGNR